MRYVQKVALILLPVVVLALAGCGGGSSSTSASDPLSTGDTSGGTLQGNGSVLNHNLTLSPSKSATWSNEELMVTATLKGSGDQPVANQTVNFSISAGPATAVTTSVKTDSNGVGLAFIKTGLTAVTTNVIVQGAASVNNTSVIGYGSFQVSPADTNLSSTRLSLAISSFTTRPNQELLVTATAKDGSGSPLANQLVTFSITAGPAAMVSSSVTTDSNGVAIAVAKAGNSAAISNVIVQAATTVNANEVKAVIPFQIEPLTLSSVNYTMTMTPSKPVVDNSEEFYVTALLQDSGGTPVIGQTVSFSVVAGEAAVLTATANTDSTGKAIARVHALNPASTSSVILQASTSVSGTQVTALAPVQITTQVHSPSILKMTLASGKASVGINSDVLLTASITDSQEFPKPVQNQPISFSIVAGPASIIDASGAVVPAASINTDSVGNAVCRLKSGTVNSSSSIIVQASTTVSGTAVNAYTTIQIVRQDSMIIKFLTTKPPTDPDGTLNRLQSTIPWDSAIAQYGFVQLVPFEILDGNGVPMPNVNVTVAVYSAQGQSTVGISPPSPLITDDHGMGIFNVSVMLTSLPLFPGTSNSDAIVYVATASANGINLKSYGGFIISIAREKKPQ